MVRRAPAPAVDMPSSTFHTPPLPQDGSLSAALLSHPVVYEEEPSSPESPSLTAEGQESSSNEDTHVRRSRQALVGCWANAYRLLASHWRLCVTVLVGVVLYALPRPVEIRSQGWLLLAIFGATIVGILVQVLPAGACALIGASLTVLTGTLTFHQAFNGFNQEAPWLIALAIFLATGINKTGLGKRLACVIVRCFGSTALGLTYSLVFSEFLLGPAIPSVAARSGAIFLPIIRSLAETCGSRPDDGTERDLGAYLMLTCFQTAAVTCSTFLTASHPNPLSAALAKSLMDEDLTWMTWVKGSIVPAIVDILAIPLVLWYVYPPRLRSTHGAKLLADSELQRMGRLKKNEWIMAIAMIVTIVLWLIGPLVKVTTVMAGAIGLMILLFLGVLQWEDCLKTKIAWDTVTWLGFLMAMANQLKEAGVIGVVQKNMTSLIKALNWHWFPSMVLLVVLYVYIHYFFASNIAHVSALYTSFVGVAISVGSPKLLAALVFAYFSNLMGTITHYGMTHGPLFLGQGYVPLPIFLGIGLMVSVVNLIVWFGVGAAWWRFVGFWN